MNQLDEHQSAPYVQIIEQPARSAVRFRYECEGRSAGPIPGVSSNSQSATYPSIQVCNYKGRAMVVVSCVTSNPPYRQHPHHLVGRIGCHNGICSMIIDNEDMTCSFTHLGIQCAKRNEIASRLKQRKNMSIDPTNAGFDHVNKSSRAIDLGVIRLCFQVFIEDPITGKFTVALQPVISDPVHDKKLLPKLIISDISSTSAPMNGQSKVMIFCNYIDEDDIEVRFFETQMNNGQIIWEALADLKPPVGEVHKRVALSFMAPNYPFGENKRENVQVFLQLRRPSDGRTSEPLIFTYLQDCSHKSCPLANFHKHNVVFNQNNPSQFNQNQPKNNNNQHSIVNKTPITLQIPSISHPESSQSSCPSPSTKRNLMDNAINGLNGFQDQMQDQDQLLSFPSQRKKRAKVLDVINRSDSEEEEDGQFSCSSMEISMNDSMNSFCQTRETTSSASTPNPITPDGHKSFINQMTSPFVDSNNNNLPIQDYNNNNENFISSADNDLLLECLKTIDLGYLNNVELNECDNELTDWSLLC